MSTVETRPDVYRITTETTDFPPYGATVRIEPGVSVIRGLHFGDVAGRGVDFYRNGHSPKPVETPVQRPQAIGAEDMNA